EEAVVVAGAGEGGVAERGHSLESAGDVDVAGGVQREIAGGVRVGPTAAADPEHVALGRELREEGVVVAGADEGGVAERGQLLEAACDAGRAVGGLCEAGGAVG